MFSIKLSDHNSFIFSIVTVFACITSSTIGHSQSIDIEGAYKSTTTFGDRQYVTIKGNDVVIGNSMGLAGSYMYGVISEYLADSAVVVDVYKGIYYHNNVGIRKYHLLSEEYVLYIDSLSNDGEVLGLSRAIYRSMNNSDTISNNSRIPLSIKTNNVMYKVESEENNINFQAGYHCTCPRKPNGKYSRRLRSFHFRENIPTELEDEKNGFINTILMNSKIDYGKGTALIIFRGNDDDDDVTIKIQQNSSQLSDADLAVAVSNIHRWEDILVDMPRKFIYLELETYKGATIVHSPIEKL